MQVRKEMSFFMGRRQRPNLLTAMFLNGLVVLGALTGIAACGFVTLPSTSSRQPDGAAVAVLEGTLIVANSASEQEAKAGENIYVSTGGRFRSGPDAAVTLRLPDQSLLHLASSTASEVEDWSPAGNIVLRGLSGTLKLEALSDKTTLKMSSVTAFGLNSLDITAVPAPDGAVVSMAVDVDSVHLTVEQGKVNLSINGSQYQAVAGTEVSATPNQDPDIKIPGASPTAIAATPTLTTTRILTTPTPATISTTQTYSYTAPVLLGPANQVSIKAGEVISLTWQAVAETNPDQWYEVQLWLDTAAPYTVIGRTASTSWGPLSGLQAGFYHWRIRLVRLSDAAYLSPPSETRDFTLLRASSVSVSTPAPPPAQIPTPPVSGGGARSYSKPTSISPANEAKFQATDTITLSWNSAGTLQADEWYEVRLWENGTQWRGTAQTRDTSWQVSNDYNPGRYGWQVAVIIIQDGKWLKDISPQSDMRFFTWEAPPTTPGHDKKSSDGGSSGGPPRR
jgi:quercetin dioxygenase-like cupin family protein